ncbi:MAG: Glu/Leu/Phe/Val dehydrogenase [Chitinophagia bacterium]|nr:Glu/Leu/Phe/Val dehydrogenase [Chitinophagia bacterium]
MQSSVFTDMQSLGHEQVVFCQDPKTGLNAIIAIHNTTLGPSLGGTRLWNYNSHADALTDALRLSRGMTYKSAISGLNLGGGKAVLIGNAADLKCEAYWRRYGKFVNSLNGKYITAEDVNTSSADMEYIRMETRFVTGVPEFMGGSGDPSPFTAYGVYVGMKAAAKHTYGSESLAGKKVVVQGAGNVGRHLIDHLAEEKAQIFVSDINESNIQKVAQKHSGVVIADNSTIFDLDADIYAPCALGATLNTDTIARLKCAIVAGAANNQLADENIHGPMLVEKGIVYVPDFLINAGGIINISVEIDGYNKQRSLSLVEKIYQRTIDNINHAKQHRIHNQMAAMQAAQARIDSIAALRPGI